jgi:hypothetical protein
MYDVTPARASVDIHCPSARAFLQLLDPIHGIFTSGTFIFRGVPSKEHGLLPSAHRRDVTLYTSEHETAVGPRGTHQDQCAAEFYTLNKFFSILSRNGVRVPEDSYLLRQHLDDWFVRFEQRPNLGALQDHLWPSPELFSLMALAQHHGIPTRALDWTSSAHAAAYFGARPVLVSKDDDFIGVWAVDDFTRKIDHVLDITADRPLSVFTVSGADNDNLRAQRGLFMLHRERLGGTARTFHPREYDLLLHDSMPVLKGAAVFIRVLVHHAAAREVLALLAFAGITAGTLYPGLAGAAREYDEEQLVQPSLFAHAKTLDAIGLWDKINEAAKKLGA